MEVMNKGPMLATLATVLSTGGMIAIGEEGTRLANLKQPPLNTTMMGVLKSAADYHGLGLSEPMVFGLSGHAFLINIHTQLCPSGPYCWKRENAEPLIRNMGLKMTDLGFFGTNATKEARGDVERKLREALDKGIPCALINMENQIVGGYDATGFFSAQPWANSDFPPARLSFGTWQEFGKEIHVNFYTIEKTEPIVRQQAIIASLEYAVDMFKNPAKHSSKDYAVGPLAYDNWIAAIPTSGSSHGNWWNATVWSECRQMAARYFTEIGKANAQVAGLCAQLNVQYLKIADNLKMASEKTMEPEAKIRLLKETKQLETAAIESVAELAAALRVPKKP
jgi:hypothetical protein